MFDIIKKKKCPPPYRGVRPEKLLSDKMVVTTKDVYYPALSGNKKYQIWSRAGQMVVKFGSLFAALIIVLFFIVRAHKNHKPRPKSPKTIDQAEKAKPVSDKQVMTASLASSTTSTSTLKQFKQKASDNTIEPFRKAKKVKKENSKKKVQRNKSHKSQKKVQSYLFGKQKKQKVKKDKALNAKQAYPYTSKKLYGLKDKQGKTILPPQFIYIAPFDKGKARVRQVSQKDSYFFFIDSTGQCVDGCEGKKDLFLIRKVANQYGFFTLNNTSISNERFDAVRFRLSDSIPARKGKKWGYFSIAQRKWLPK